MRPIRVKRLLFVLILCLGAGLVVSLILYALRQNMNLFYTPSQVMQGEAPQNIRIRMGGIVKPDSVSRGNDLQISFLLSDLQKEVQVCYRGSVPDLFREGQGVVVSGVVATNQILMADEILAKHDENYRRLP